MECKKCKGAIPDGAPFCPWCGMRQEVKPKGVKTRGNGTGTAFKNGRTWTAQVTLGVYVGKDGVQHRKYRTKGGFKTKTEALAYCSTLKGQRANQSAITLIGLYDKWLPTYEGRIGKQTLSCYKCAFKHFEALHFVQFRDIKTEDWQQCIDNCPRGKSTKEDMRTIAGLLSKYAYDNDIIDKVYSAHLHTGKENKGTRPAFTLAEMDKIKSAVGTVLYADYIYFMCYTGFRPTEMFNLKKAAYNPGLNTLIGGGKTKAGTDRTITLSPKLAQIMQDRLSDSSQYLFPRADGTRMTEEYFRKFCFVPAMEKLGIADRTPYSCRHTFANLLKAVPGSDTDKAALMGHADASMTKYYQSEDVQSLRAITDLI